MKIVHVRKDNYDVYVGRGSKWGNPFRIGPDGDRAMVLTKYYRWILTRPDLLRALPELRGRTLGCFCAPRGGLAPLDPLVCHGQILARLALGELPC